MHCKKVHATDAMASCSRETVVTSSDKLKVLILEAEKTCLHKGQAVRGPELEQLSFTLMVEKRRMLRLSNDFLSPTLVLLH